MLRACLGPLPQISAVRKPSASAMAEVGEGWGVVSLLCLNGVVLALVLHPHLQLDWEATKRLPLGGGGERVSVLYLFLVS